MKSPAKRLALVALLLIPVPALAATGSLLVEVRGPNDRPVADATITIESRAGEVKTGTSDANGNITIPGLATGFHKATIVRAGYITVVEPDVRIVRDRTVPLSVQLRQLEAGVEVVSVVAEKIQADPFGPVSTTYVDREDLRTAPGGGADVLRALDGLPGLATDGEFASFTVRGRGPRDNLILVDDFPYDRVVHFDQNIGEQEDVSGGGRFSIFAPNTIAGAEFSPGGWSAEYGGRNGSLLRLDLAEGNPSPVGYLRLDLAGLELGYDGPSGFHDDTSMLFTARQFDFGSLFDAIGELDIGEPVMTDVVLKTHTDFDNGDELEFLFLYTPETFDRGVTHVLESPNFQDRGLIDIDQDAMLAGVTWRHFFRGNAQWENRLYFRNTEITGSEGEAFPDSTPMTVPPAAVPVREDILTQVENETEYGWRSDFSLVKSWGLFSAGLRVAQVDPEYSTTLDGDWIRFTYDQDDFRPDPTQNYIVLTPADTDSRFSGSETQYAAYANQVFQVGDWNLRAGVRYDHDGFSDEGYVAPRLAANYKINPRARLSMTAGTFYQSPRFFDRAADAGNVALENEKIDHISLGYNHTFGKNWNLLIEGYNQRLSDLVVANDDVTGQATNAGEGTSYGFDVVVKRRSANGWFGDATYSFNDATLNDNDGNGDYDADFNHEHIFSLGSRWEISERWQVGWRWKYVTGRPRDAFIVNADVLADLGGPLRFSQESITNNTLRWDDYHTLNARVDYRTPAGPFDLVAFLDVLNVYGGSTTDEQEFNSATGTVVVDDGEALPLIGLRIEKTW